MWRSILFIAKAAVLVAVAVWLAYQPSRVTLELFDYRIDTSVGVLVLFVFLVTLASLMLYRSWRLLAGTPGSIGRRLRENRRRRGYNALSQGMVAVAAGDPEEARRWARKAEVLMEEPPLTLLLAAQAAQLNGDDQAAKRYFQAMLEREETRFMGLRGCLMQALREGDKPAALDYVRQAQAMRPKTPWVLSAMIELSEATGDLPGAERAIRQAARHKVLTSQESQRKRAVVLLERALAARAARRAEEAIKLAREAQKLEQGLVPATVLLVELLVAAGRVREAARTIERAWPAQPHPALARAYRATQPEVDVLERIAQVKKLTAAAPEHCESLVALAEAALEAQLWGEARKHLAKAAGGQPTERICRLMARLEEQEHGDAAKARSWLMRAADAPSDPAWVCDTCGALAERWAPHCGACNTFDSLTWRPPIEVLPEAAEQASDSGFRPPPGLPARTSPTQSGPTQSGPTQGGPAPGDGSGRALAPVEDTASGEPAPPGRLPPR